MSIKTFPHYSYTRFDSVFELYEEIKYIFDKFFFYNQEKTQRCHSFLTSLPRACKRCFATYLEYLLSKPGLKHCCTSEIYLRRLGKRGVVASGHSEKQTIMLTHSEPALTHNQFDDTVYTANVVQICTKHMQKYFR